MAFIALKLCLGDVSSSPAVSPSPQVDAFWHFHILETAEYRKLMDIAQQTYPGFSYLEHSNRGVKDPENVRKERMWLGV